MYRIQRDMVEEHVEATCLHVIIDVELTTNQRYLIRLKATAKMPPFSTPECLHAYCTE